MMQGAAILSLLVFMTRSVDSQTGTLPFQVNSPPIETCATKFRLETTTLTDVKRGDDSYPCVGYLEYSKGPNFRKVCGYERSFNDYAAERACYTMGVNFYRDSGFSSETRQMMLYRCFQYSEQNVLSVESDTRSLPIFHASYMIENEEQDTGCTDGTADPTVFDCFDECHFYGSTLESMRETSCGDQQPYWAISCTDINECLNGVHDNCTGPFETSCTIRKACGDNTVCTNYPGSFECGCAEGYKEKNGKDFDPYDLHAGCVDIDECKISKCDGNADCSNTPGSYICTCKDGFSGDGHTCTRKQCDPVPSLPNAVVAGNPFHQYDYGDEVEFTCATGYNIPVQNVPYTLVDYYGFTEMDSFKLTCDESGKWGPIPVPICTPINCGEPVSIPFTTRSGSGFLYGQQVIYECENGFRPSNAVFGPSSFRRTCQANGKWTEGTTCVDDNECDDGPCDGDKQTCFNTMGSYLCVSKLPEACKLMEMLSSCDHGECEEDKGIARCVCEPGYHGVGCDQTEEEEKEPETADDDDDTTRILAIVALVLAIFLLLMAIAYCIFQVLRGWEPRKAMLPPAPMTDMGYGTYPPVKPYYSRRRMF